VWQVQEFKTGATRQNMESMHAKEECKRLRTNVADSRDKLSDLDSKVSASHTYDVPLNRTHSMWLLKGEAGKFHPPYFCSRALVIHCRGGKAFVGGMFLQQFQGGVKECLSMFGQTGAPTL